LDDLVHGRTLSDIRCIGVLFISVISAITWQVSIPGFSPDR
jgi:hypothetical protein